MGMATALFALAASAIVAVWAWLGAAVQMPPSPLGRRARSFTASPMPRFAAARTRSAPTSPSIPQQIDEDLAQLKQITDCVRTYSIDHGLDQIPEIARRHGMKVLQGLWLSSRPDLSRKQIETAIALAKRFPDVIAAVVVGNEVLLRGEMSAPDLARTIREVKAQVSMPVTYADVWEFWLRHRDIAGGGRFHHHPYPALLGGLPDPGQRRGARMSTPSASRWWRRFPARISSSASSAGRAPAACAKARCRRRSTRRASSMRCSRWPSARATGST